MTETLGRTDSWIEAGAGHFWTLACAAKGSTWIKQLWPGYDGFDHGRAWSTIILDERWGNLELSGRLHEVKGASTIVVVVHGLGGSPDSQQIQRTSLACREFGWSSLRVALRGSDLRGQDFYHAGLTADIDGVLASEEVAKYRRVHLIGYSLGGHLVLRWSVLHPDQGNRIVAVCPPLDLHQSVLSIDEPQRWPYRHYLLRGLRQIYRKVAEHREVPFPVEELSTIRRIIDWDHHIVAPHHGFSSALDYYRKMSVASQLSRIRHESLIIHTRQDPMVSWASVAPILQDEERTLPSNIRVRSLLNGGHCGFPSDLDLGFGFDRHPGIYRQILAWCAH